MGEITTKDQLILKSKPLREAMDQLNVLGVKTLFVTDDQGLYLGTLTDSDIRRWLLRDGKLVDPIDGVFKAKSFFVTPDYQIAQVASIMAERGYESVPVIGDGKVVEVINWSSVFGKKKERKKDVLAHIPTAIMAGGRGKRMAPFTNIIPKPLIPIGDKPIIEVIMNSFNQYGCNKFYITVGYKSAMIKAYLSSSDLPYQIEFIEDREYLGTAGSLVKITDLSSDQLFVSNCDIMVDVSYEKIANFHIEKKSDLTIVAAVKYLELPYGVVTLKTKDELDSFMERPGKDYFINTGMYLMNTKVLEEIPPGKEFDMTDLIEKMRAKKGKVTVFLISENTWRDVGQWTEYHNTLSQLGLK